MFYKCLLLYFVLILGSCSGKIEDSHAYQDRESKELSCEPIPVGVYQAYAQYLIGDCYPIEPFGFIVDTKRDIYLSETCKTVKKYYESKTCQNVFYISCTSQEKESENVLMYIRMFLSPLENLPDGIEKGSVWGGQLDLEFKDKNTGKVFCNSIFDSKILRISPNLSRKE